MNKIVLVIMALLLVQKGALAQHDGPDSSRIRQFRQKFWDNLPKPTGWVNDFDNIFSSREKNGLDSLIRSYEKRTGAEIAIVTLDTAVVDRERVNTMAAHILNTWGVGKKKENNGILIAIFKGYRMMRIENGYGISKWMSDDETKEIIDQYFIPRFKNGDFYGGVRAGISRIMELLDTKKKH